VTPEPTHTPTDTPTDTPTETEVGPTLTSTPSIVPPQPPSQPILIAPQPGETVADPSLTFVWMENPAWENVTAYKLIVRNRAGVIAYRANVLPQQCAAGSCSQDLGASGATLANGSYTWLVKAKSAIGKGKSQIQSFTVESPGKPTLFNPESRTAVVDRDPQFSWSEIGLAAEYQLVVKKKERKVFVRWFTPSELVCDGLTCTVDLSDLSVELPYGNLRWRVKTRNKAISPNVSRSDWSHFKILRPPQ
jgi:hypothetical protein